jgi:circadian clock protein KaiC
VFLRLGLAADQVGAKRGNEAIVRSELARLLRWLKDRGLMVVITGEHGRPGELTRYGIEEYVSDCVVVLDDQVSEELSTRRLRIAKYRGSLHGTNEYPFLITDRGIVVLPVTSIGLVRWVDAGLLRLWAVRPTAYGLEEHLVALHRLLDEAASSSSSSRRTR